MRPLLALVVCLSASPAFPQTLESAFAEAQALPFGAFSRAKQPLGAAPRVRQGAASDLLHTIDLAPLLNAVRGTSASFLAGSTRVHVFGDKSQNKNEWFVGFAPEGGAPIYRKGKKMLHWSLLINRTVEFTVNGTVYQAYVAGQMRNRMQSRLIVERKNKASGEGPVFEQTIEQLSTAAFMAGRPVRIGGTAYHLLYSENFNEDANGDFGGYSGDRSIVLMYRDGSKFSGLHWFEREIPSNSIRIMTPTAVNSDDARGAAALTLGLRMAPGRQFEIHYPVQ